MNKKDLKLFINIPTLNTERLILRKIEKSDLNDVHDYASDPEVSRFLLWNPHQSIEFTKLYLKTVSSFYKKGIFYDWGIVDKKSGKLIGTCGFTDIDVKNESAEVGYVLNRNFWGQKIAKEALLRVLEFGFVTLGLNRIEARYLIENERSRRVLEKCGMKYEGTLKDAIKVKGKFKTISIFAITKKEYSFILREKI